MNIIKKDVYKDCFRIFAPHKKTNLYVFKAGDFFKVGLSTQLNKRLSSIQGGCPLEVTLFDHREIAMTGDIFTENHAHWLLRNYHVRGEWFQCREPKINTAIERAVKFSIKAEEVLIKRFDRKDAGLRSGIIGAEPNWDAIN